MIKSINSLLKIVFIISFPLMLSLSSPVLAQDHAQDTMHQNTDLTVEHSERQSGHHESNLGVELSLLWVIPFIGILLSIALFPLIAPHFWHKHFPKISAMWALVFAVPFYFVYPHDAFHEIMHIYLLDYIPFIILLWGLFTISGGILIKGTLKGTPQVNLIIILIGTLMASWIGTTGAAMVMIRPLLRANQDRKYKVHLVVFFIFLVANVGGSLTPLGDPPLFLGFLHGVSFFWTMSLLPQMSVLVFLLLILFFLFDSFYYRKEKNIPQESGEKEPLRIEGSFNFILLLGVVGGVIFSGVADLGKVHVLGIEVANQSLARDGWIILMGLVSLKLTRKKIRDGNEFSWFPILEVAYLFAGIFMTIIPALLILKAGPNGALASLVTSVKEAWHYFWVTGTLSSFLDNAPTYLTFFNSALGSLGINEDCVRVFMNSDFTNKFPEMVNSLANLSLSGKHIQEAFVAGDMMHKFPEFVNSLGKMGLTADQIRDLFSAGHKYPEFITALAGLGVTESQVVPIFAASKYPVFIEYLTAISIGAVFMGANTYIGNAPNFMVKSIAEESGISMPSFFGYMLKYSIPILIPSFIIVSLIFL